jgi:uncharacterized Zn-binding protein involved in type VI secretion
MSLPIARAGDIWTGYCSVHGVVSGIISVGSTLTLDESKPVARVGDQVIAFCGHTGTIVAGSTLTLDESKPVARVGDRIAGSNITGTIIGGSTLTNSD